MRENTERQRWKKWQYLKCKKVKMSEIKLATGEKTNTSYLVSLHIFVTFIISPRLHLFHCLPLISLFADSLSISFSPQQWDNKWPALRSLTFSLTLPLFSSPFHPLPFCSHLLPLFNVLEECVREAQKNKSLTGGGGGGGGKWGEGAEEGREIAWGKGEAEEKRENGGKEWAGRERLRGAEHGWVDLNAEQCFVITCWHAASHTFRGPLSPPHLNRMHTRWVSLSLCYNAQLSAGLSGFWCISCYAMLIC